MKPHNLANEDEVKEHNKKHDELTKRQIDDVKFLLQSIQGRRFLGRLLDHCSVFSSIYHASALIHHNSGKQDVGHFIMGEIVKADDMAFIQMMKEAKENNL